MLNNSSRIEIKKVVSAIILKDPKNHSDKVLLKSCMMIEALKSVRRSHTENSIWFSMR